MKNAKYSIDYVLEHLDDFTWYFDVQGYEIAQKLYSDCYAGMGEWVAQKSWMRLTTWTKLDKLDKLSESSAFLLSLC